MNCSRLAELRHDDERPAQAQRLADQLRRYGRGNGVNGCLLEAGLHAAGDGHEDQEWLDAALDPKSRGDLTW